MQLYTIRKSFYCRWIRYIKRIDNKTHAFIRWGRWAEIAGRKGKRREEVGERKGM